MSLGRKMLRKPVKSVVWLETYLSNEIRPATFLNDVGTVERRTF